MKNLNDMTKDELLNELRLLVATLKNSLPSEVPIYICSSIDPTRAVVLREACLYRITEISEGALDAFEENNLIVALILCRSIMETEALFWEFEAKLKTSIASKNVEEIRTFLTRCMIGVKSEEIKKMKSPENTSQILDPINVLTFIDKLGKHISKYRFHYDSLSERSHPNAAGTVDAYVDIDWEAGVAKFGLNSKKIGYNPSLLLLVASLSAFLDVYDSTAKHLSDFTKVCEELVEKENVWGEKIVN